MLNEIPELLEAAGFHVQKTKFINIISDSKLRDVIKTYFKDTDLAKILINYPHYFLMHSSADPEKGYLYALVIEESVNLPSNNLQLYKAYFPSELMLLRVDSKEKQIQATWFNHPNNWSLLGSFLRSEIGIIDLKKLEQILKSKGWKA